jgi:hypothetical protein
MIYFVISVKDYIQMIKKINIPKWKTYDYEMMNFIILQFHNFLYEFWLR